MSDRSTSQKNDGFSIPEWGPKATYAETLGPAMEITDPDHARSYFDALVRFHLARGHCSSREQAEVLVRQNLGYYAGYYSHEARERVERLFSCEHPVFGKASAGSPTPEEALHAGMAAGKAARRGR